MTADIPVLPAEFYADGLLIPVLAGAVCAALFFAFAMVKKAREAERLAAIASNRLQAAEARLDEVMAIANADAQCVLLWLRDEPKLVRQTLNTASGAPAALTQIIRFGGWIEDADAAKLNALLAGQKKSGSRFIAFIITRTGTPLEAVGFVFGASRVLILRETADRLPDLTANQRAAQELGKRLDERNALLDALPVPVWIRSANGALSWVNKAYAHAVESPSPQAVLHGQIELFETRQRRQLEVAAKIRPRDRTRMQTVISGGRRIFDAVALNVNGGSAGAAFDAAPLASAQDELRLQMEAYTRTLDKVATGIAVFGAGQRLRFHNEAFVRMWLLDERWLDEKPPLGALLDRFRSARLLPEQSNYRRWREDRIAACASNETIDEWWHIPDGRTIRVFTDFRADGDVTFLFDDVTEKLALERQYHDVIEVQRETLDHLREGVAVFGADGKLRLWNSSFKEIWDFDEAQLEAGLHLNAIALLCEDKAADKTLWRLARAAITGIDDEREAFSGHLARRDGTHLAYAGMPLPDGSMLLTFVDITDSKRVEEVLLERNEALEAADRLKSSFLSHISYELRTPLTSIIGFTDLLNAPQTGVLSPKQREYLQDIKTSSMTLLTIINDILDLATIDAGAMELKLGRTAVQEAVDTAALGVRDRLIRSNITLAIRIAPGAATVTADQRRLTQILYNLLSNAIGFSEEGGAITLSCKKQNGMFAFSVQDTGCGIPEEEQSRVFNRFESLSQGSKHRGAGLGLSLVKSLVELHNGVIDLRSTPGAGTTVTVLIPDHEPEAIRTIQHHDAQKAPSPLGYLDCCVKAQFDGILFR